MTKLVRKFSCYDCGAEWEEELPIKKLECPKCGGSKVTTPIKKMN